MATTIKRDVAAPASALWAAVTNFADYGRVIPLTQICCDPGQPGIGWRFVGRTALGPLAFDDPMRIIEWTPPTEQGTGVFAVQKEGRVLAGWARVEVVPRGAGASRLRWSEEIRPALPSTGRLPRATADLAGHPSMRAVGRVAATVTGAVSDTATHVLFGRAVSGLAAQAERPQA